jgi:hypothetical protein
VASVQITRLDQPVRLSAPDPKTVITEQQLSKLALQGSAGGGSSSPQSCHTSAPSPPASAGHGAYQSTTVVRTSHFGYSVSGSGSVRSSEVGSPQPTHS